MKARARFAIGPGEVTGAVADLGILIPLAAALVLVNGLSGGTVLVGAGALVIASGAWSGLPFPVQPLKALTAVAVARQLDADVIMAAGLIIGAVLLVLSLGRTADHISRVFTPTVIRALQLGVGLLLIVAASRLAFDPPAVFDATAPAATSPLRWSLPGLPGGQAFVTAAFLLVLPQLPLTFGNAVVAVTDVARRTFGDRARAVTPRAVCRSAGIGNIVVSMIGGMPMCHGSSGLTAHYRLGARTAGMSLLLGGALIALGVTFGDQAPAVLGQLPPAVLAALLAYAGVRHAWLVADLRGWRLAVAILAGTAGAATGNLLVTMVVAMIATSLPTVLRRRRASVVDDDRVSARG
ncbi:MAG: hypothetical protein GEU74_05675 [Nitriliruptorales bacterium]|nr:hypothetical protein [Nitriliruptorales bacterium]